MCGFLGRGNLPADKTNGLRTPVYGGGLRLKARLLPRTVIRKAIWPGRLIGSVPGSGEVCYSEGVRVRCLNLSPLLGDHPAKNANWSFI